MDRFTLHRRLQPVCDMPRYLMVDPDRLLAERGIEIAGPIDRPILGLPPADHLHQWDQMRRVERVAEHEAPGARKPRLYLAHEQARRARCQHRLRAQRIVDPTEELTLERQVLRRVFLHEGHIGDGIAGIVMPGDLRGVGTGRKTELFHRRPSVFDET